MPNTQKQSQKKKDREKEVRKKVLRRREAMRRARKEEAAKEAALENEYFEKHRAASMSDEERGAMLEKITGKAVKKLTDDERKLRDEAIIARLKKNIELLEGLEKQYLDEQAEREKTNKLLEGEGATTIKEKLDLMKEIQKKKLEEAPKLELVGV